MSTVYKRIYGVTVCVCSDDHHVWLGVKNPILCPENICGTSQPFKTKLGMGVHHHEPECDAQKMICCLQGQGHSEGWCDENMTVCVVCSELPILLQTFGLIYWGQDVECLLLPLLYITNWQHWNGSWPYVCVFTLTVGSLTISEVCVYAVLQGWLGITKLSCMVQWTGQSCSSKVTVWEMLQQNALCMLTELIWVPWSCLKVWW